MDRNEGDERYANGVADKYGDLQADVLWKRWHVPNSQYDGGGECHLDAGQRGVRIG
jgi:hypothetical protein